MLHALKTTAAYFEDILSGNKTFEVRKFDRPFEVDNDIVLQEYDTLLNRYTGREWYGRITYILDDPDYCKKGFCIMGIKQNII